MYLTAGTERILPYHPRRPCILARHMNYCTAIGMGTAHVVLEDGTERKAACIGGMLTMMNGECRLIPTTWEWSEDIDVARAEEAKKRQKIN